MKKFFTALIGGTVLLMGVALLVLPGPGVLVMLAGLAILATEFIWAKHALRNAKDAVAKARSNWWRKSKTPAAPQPPP